MLFRSAGKNYDPNLKPDWTLSGAINNGALLLGDCDGGLQLRLINGNYSNGQPYTDKVTWGNGPVGQGNCKAPSPCAYKTEGALQRKPSAMTFLSRVGPQSPTGVAMQDPTEAAYYAGAGYTTNTTCADWAIINPGKSVALTCKPGDKDRKSTRLNSSHT